jgi:hypothetical protein
MPNYFVESNPLFWESRSRATLHCNRDRVHFLVHHAFHSKGFAEFAVVLCIDLVICKPLNCPASLKYITIECMDETVDGEGSCTQALGARLKAELVSDVCKAFT